MLYRGRMGSGRLQRAGMANPHAAPRYSVIASYIKGSPLVTTGVTTARTTDLRLPDASGVYQQYGNGEVGIVDGNAVWCQPGATNLQLNSQQPYNGTNGWIATPATITRDFTTLMGLNAARVARTVGGAASAVGAVGTASLTGATAGRTFTASFWCVNNGGETSIELWLNETGGASGSTNTVKTITLADEVQRFTITRTLTANDRTALSVNFGVSKGAGTHDHVAVAYQIEESAFATSWIPTAGSADAILATEPKFTTVNPTTNFSGSFRWKPAAASQGTIWLLGNYTDANNAWGVLHDGTNVIFRNRVSGSNNDAVKALNYSADTEYLIHFRHDTVNGLDIAVDRVKGTNDSTTTAVTNATDTYLGQDGNDASHMTGSIRDIRIQKHVIGWSDSEWLAT